MMEIRMLTRAVIVAMARKVALRLAENKVGGSRLTKTQIDGFYEAKRIHDKQKRVVPETASVRM
jgi:hypothetical protein